VVFEVARAAGVVGDGSGPVGATTASLDPGLYR
jgi:hypothetical protein